MSENPMTFRELVDYANEAKKRVEKRQLDAQKKKESEIVELIKNVIDELETSDCQTIEFIKYKNEFTIGKIVSSVTTEITVEELIDDINQVPALEAYCSANGNYIATWNKTEETEMLETDGSEDK